MNFEYFVDDAILEVNLNETDPNGYPVTVELSADEYSTIKEQLGDE